MHYTRLVIRNIHEEAEGFKTFSFEEGHGLSYQAGQYLTFLVDGQPSGERRSYSIISVPQLNEPLSIGVKRIENGIFSRWLIDRARPGDELISTGTGGFFTLPPDLGNFNQLFFFAAGSGITPIFSLIKAALNLYPHLKVFLFYSSPSPEKAVFLQHLQELSKRFPESFKLHFFFGNSKDLREARLNKEILSQLLLHPGVDNPSKTLFYICGPEAYMRMCTYALQEAGMPVENIRRENFFIERVPPPKLRPPNTSKHYVTLVQDSISLSLEVQYPQTILQAARKKGLDMPYSCETGRCGNCVAKCTRGQVWMSYNEVLTQNELDQGLVLTCVGYPLEDSVLEI